MMVAVEPRESRSLLSHLSPSGHPVLSGIVLLALVVVIGATGYLTIEEGWTAFDAFYMTILTITTVGFHEVHPLSPAGQVFTSFLAVTGLGVLLYTLARVAHAVFEGELANALGKRRMMSRIDELEDHYVICGFGKVGRPVAEGLATNGFPFVVVESTPEVGDQLADLGFLHLIGDATDESVLERAGVKNARTLLTLLPSDADNLYVTITARDLNPDIKVISRATDRSGEVRLKRAGASDVVSPARIAGLRVLQAAVNPTAVEFMEIVTHQQALQLSLADIEITENSELSGRTIAECGIRGRYGVIIVAVKRESGMLFNPDPGTTITPGDVLLVLGEDMDIAQLQSDSG
jgi:voltage-gated potassium channel